MLRKPGARFVAITVGVLLAAAAIWWGYQAHLERQLVSAVTALAREAGTRLRDALRLDAMPPAGHAEETARKFEAHFTAVEAHLQKLRSMDTSSMPALGEAVDDYVLTGREILRRLAASHRARLQFAQSTQELQAHMRADRGGASWVGEAVRRKDRVEKDFSEHKAATETLAKLLAAFPASQTAIAPYVGTPLLIDEKLLDAVRQRALASAQRATEEIGKIRKWVPRGQGRHRPG